MGLPYIYIYGPSKPPQSSDHIHGILGVSGYDKNFATKSSARVTCPEQRQTACTVDFLASSNRSPMPTCWQSPGKASCCPCLGNPNHGPLHFKVLQDTASKPTFFVSHSQVPWVTPLWIDGFASHQTSCVDIGHVRQVRHPPKAVLHTAVRFE